MSTDQPVKLDILVRSYYGLLVWTGLTYSEMLIITIRNKIVIFCYEEYSVICGRQQGTVLRFRSERSEIYLKLAECQEQISVL